MPDNWIKAQRGKQKNQEVTSTSQVDREHLLCSYQP